MTVYIGSARIDERGQARGGKAGDQTGTELSRQKWYRHKLGWRVLRCTDFEKAQKIADAMRAACLNPNIGYDQGQRLTLYEAAKPLGFDPGRVKTRCECDCSSLVRVCLAYAGVTVGNFRTATEADALIATGWFVELSGPQYTDSPDYLREGDVLVTKTRGHTVIALGDGPRAEPAPLAPLEEGDGYVRVAARGRWRVREQPDLRADTVALVAQGERLRCYGRREGWYAVKCQKGKGWVSGKAFEEEGSA